MSASNVYERTMKHIFTWEGGYVDHPNDPGGATNYGITRQTLANWRGKPSIPKQEVKDLSYNEAAQIYRANYWNKILGDDLPPSIAMLMMDAAVNSGPGAAIKTLQRAVGALGEKIKVDGAIGPNTLRAVRQIDEEKLLNEFVVRRGVFYGSLKTFTSFGLGWARRLVSGARLAHSILTDSRNGATEPAEPVENPADTPANNAPSIVEPSPLLPANISLKRHFFDERGIQVYGSFFQLWGGWITAGHVIRQMLNTSPPFASGQQILYPGQMDAALMGCTIPDQQPRAPVIGQKIVVAGYPAGSSTPSFREAEVYMQRPQTTDWIATISSPAEPVVVGMSGGVVYDATSKAIVGILITRNSPADLDADDRADQNFDFVAMYDVWNQLRTFPPVGV